ncbi:MAG: DUF4412 domain-containing protein [Bacteroidetes bacterium]|nr:DUF4412 domain-containing protein [Bacteroidota bacterium]
MKKVPSFLFLQVFVIASISFLNGQSFEGMLVYAFSARNVDPMDYVLTEEIGPNIWHKEFNNKRHVYYVKKDTIVYHLFLNDTFLSHSVFQHEREAHLHYPNLESGWIPITSYLKNDEHLTLVKKTKERKKILGYNCRKYIYERNEGEEVIEAWVAKDLRYPKQSAMGLQFRNIMVSEGMILEKTIKWREEERILKIIEIELMEVGTDFLDIMY